MRKVTHGGADEVCCFNFGQIYNLKNNVKRIAGVKRWL